jgi:hypothetical protein
MRHGANKEGRAGDAAHSEHIGTSATTETFSSNRQYLQDRERRGAIRADIVGSDTCHALGCTVRASAPVLALCRKLVEAGHGSLHRSV